MFLKVLIFGLSSSTVQLYGEKLIVVATDEFGAPLSGCLVKTFRGEASGTRPPINYEKSFRGLAAEGVPPGEYELAIHCLEGDIQQHLTLLASNQVEIIAQSGRLFRSDHVKTGLSVNLLSLSQAGETWWIRMIGMYNGRAYTAAFTGTPAGARVMDPEPGRYLVLVQSDRGKLCSQQLDFLEFTRQWTLDSRQCTFHVDRFAHIVERAPSSDGSRDHWYDEMKDYKRELLRTLRQAEEGK
jgi:hypothetical protein